MLISNSRAKVQRSKHNTKEIPKFFSLLSSKRTFLSTSVTKHKRAC